MISMANVQPLNTEALVLKGLSTDPKPIENWLDSYNQVRRVGNGSTFFEMDTSKKYVYNKQNDEWLLINSGGSGSGGDGTEYNYATHQEVIDVVDNANWGNYIPEHHEYDDYDYATDQDVIDAVNGANWNNH